MTGSEDHRDDAATLLIIGDSGADAVIKEYLRAGEAMTRVEVFGPWARVVFR